MCRDGGYCVSGGICVCVVRNRGLSLCVLSSREAICVVGSREDCGKSWGVVLSMCHDN